MKVLSLTEPFATLIKEKKKLVETRSWKTNYRGELYIHASMTKPSKNDLEDEELMSLVENKEMNFGYIICKCILVDCVYMTEEYINNISKIITLTIIAASSVLILYVHNISIFLIDMYLLYLVIKEDIRYKKRKYIYERI